MTARAYETAATDAVPSNAFSFAIAKSFLVESLARVAGLATRGKLPIAEAIHIEATGDSLVLSTTNFDQWMSTVVLGVQTQHGVAALPAKRFVEIVNALPSGQTITVTVKGRRAKITAGKSKFELVGLPPDEWAGMPTVTAECVVSIAASAFHAAIERTETHLSTIESAGHLWLNGLTVVADEAGVRMIGTDRYSWAAVALSREPVLTPFSAIVPEDAVAHLKRAVGAAAKDGVVTMEVGEQQARVRVGRTTLMTRLINASFPRDLFTQVERTPTSMVIAVDRLELAAAVNRARIVLPPNDPYLELAFAENAITLECDVQDVGESHDVVNAERTIHDAAQAQSRVALNASLLVRCLKSLPTERAQIGITHKNGPVFVRAVVPDSTPQTIAVGLFPVRLRAEKIEEVSDV